MSFSMAFRVDATTQIGTGHFVRCLTLAKALLQHSVKIRFISRGLPVHLRDMLVEIDIGFSPLSEVVFPEVPGDLAHSNWLGTSQSQDANDCAEALVDQKWDWLVVDHYALDSRWESTMRNTVAKIMVIDDLADRQHDCDVLLDQNYYRDMQTRYDGKVPEHCRKLLGPCYALLREEFWKLRTQIKSRSGEVRRILIFFGGVDAGNYTGLAIDALSGLDIKDIGVDVVIGLQHPHREDIEQACRSRGYACHVQTPYMAELMRSADIAIGAGGSASWERCCLGLPALIVAFADNQIKLSKDLAAANASIFVGAMTAISIQVMQEAISYALDNPKHLKVVSRQAFSLVDGLGVRRVVEVLFEN